MLRAPLVAVAVQATWWAGGAVLFGTLSLSESFQHVSEMVLAIVLGGVTTASRPPEEVVRELNRFFAVVIDAAEVHGDWVKQVRRGRRVVHLRSSRRPA